MIELLSEVNFRRVWLVGAITGSLRWLEMLVVAVYVLEHGGSPSLVALMTVLRLAPISFLGPLVGAIGDRYDRNSVLIIALALMVAASLVLAGLALTDLITLWLVALGALLNGVFLSFDLIIRRLVTAEIAGVDRVGQTMALESLSLNATRMLGPLLGGVLLGIVGLGGVYLLGALVYATSIVALMRVRYRLADPVRAEHGIFAGLLAGWQYVRVRRLMVGALMLTMIANFWGFSYIGMVPVIGERSLSLSDPLIGLLVAVEGLGALMGAALVGHLARSDTYIRIFVGSVLVYLLSVLGFGLSPIFGLSLLLNMMCGVCLGGYSVMQSTIMVLLAPQEMRSRALGVQSMAIGCAQLGGMLQVGFLADWLDAAAAVQATAVQGLLALAMVLLIWPELRRQTRLAPS